MAGVPKLAANQLDSMRRVQSNVIGHAIRCVSLVLHVHTQLLLLCCSRHGFATGHYIKMHQISAFLCTWM